jgi:small multidrug resistance pump
LNNRFYPVLDGDLTITTPCVSGTSLITARLEPSFPGGYVRLSLYSWMVLSAAVSFAFGGVMMKYADGLRNLNPSMLVFLLFVLGAALQIVAMRGTDLSVTYLVVLGLEAVLSFTLGLVIFKESVTLLKVVGALIVVLGIIVLRSD